MKRKFIIAIDLGGTNLKIALLDSKYKIIYKQTYQTKTFFKKESLITAIVNSVRNIVNKGGFRKKDILGIGLGLPGPIDVEKGLVHFFPNIPGWKDVNLKRILERRLKLPVFLDNDANLMCLAEHKLGSAKQATNAVCLTLGTGVGGGVIINGSLYRGSTFAAGEIGHIPVNITGPRCNCGGFACLEAYVGNKRIEGEARRLFKRNISLEEVSYLAKKNNKLAEALWDGVGRYLGRALVGIVNLLSPDCIVIGGGVASAGKILFDKIREVVSTEAMPVQARGVKIFKAKLGYDAGLIGAAILVKEGTNENIH